MEFSVLEDLHKHKQVNTFKKKISLKQQLAWAQCFIVDNRIYRQKLLENNKIKNKTSKKIEKKMETF